MKGFCRTLVIAVIVAVAVFGVGACHHEVVKKLDVVEHHDEQEKVQAETGAKTEKHTEADPVKTIEDTTTIIAPVPPGPGVKKPQPGKTIHRHKETVQGKVVVDETKEETGKLEVEKTEDDDLLAHVAVTETSGTDWTFYIACGLGVAAFLAALIAVLKFKLWRLL